MPHNLVQTPQHRNQPANAWRADVASAPRLLVSVRNAVEAREAIAGGCDVLDVKDPSRGPLGMASLEEIDRIARVRDELRPGLPLTVALGEHWEWPRGCRYPRFGDQCAGFKVGTSKLDGDRDWDMQLVGLRFQIERARFPAVTTVPAWIAVAYADWRNVGGISPDNLLSFAARNKWGLLIDTFDKSGGGLFDHLSVAELLELRERARRRTVIFAMAGRLSIDDVCRLGEIAPDVAGIRSAGCRLGRRENAIDATAVQTFKAALAQPAPG